MGRLPGQPLLPNKLCCWLTWPPAAGARNPRPGVPRCLDLLFWAITASLRLRNPPASATPILFSGKSHLIASDSTVLAQREAPGFETTHKGSVPRPGAQNSSSSFKPALCEPYSPSPRIVRMLFSTTENFSPQLPFRIHIKASSACHDFNSWLGPRKCRLQRAPRLVKVELPHLSAPATLPNKTIPTASSKRASPAKRFFPASFRV